MVPNKCPICQGSGNVPGGFYDSTPGHVETWTSNRSIDKCKACYGSGIIWT